MMYCTPTHRVWQVISFCSPTVLVFDHMLSRSGCIVLCVLLLLMMKQREKYKYCVRSMGFGQHMHIRKIRAGV